MTRFIKQFSIVGCSKNPSYILMIRDFELAFSNVPERKRDRTYSSVTMDLNKIRTKQNSGLGFVLTHKQTF
jgi:hypothetical protein